MRTWRWWGQSSWWWWWCWVKYKATRQPTMEEVDMLLKRGHRAIPMRWVDIDKNSKLRVSWRTTGGGEIEIPVGYARRAAQQLEQEVTTLELATRRVPGTEPMKVVFAVFNSKSSSFSERHLWFNPWLAKMLQHGQMALCIADFDNS